MKVQYSGETNDYTYSKDILGGSIGELIAFGVFKGGVICQVEFENGILASIDIEELRVAKCAIKPF